MTISIVDHDLPYDTHNLYDVSFYNDQIRTLVTHSAPMVKSWLSEITPIINQNPIVGLDTEWRPTDRYTCNNPVATLQLCVDHRCLIFQLLHAQTIPRALFDFLANGSYTFVGVGIQNDMEKLLVDYGLKVTNILDLGPLAATKLGKTELKKAGLKGLSKEVLGKEIQKHSRVAWSRWDSERLTCDQVQYACIDAFVSSEIGRRLLAFPSASWLRRLACSLAAGVRKLVTLLLLLLLLLLMLLMMMIIMTPQETKRLGGD